jgi:uncharacterized protein YndB with AHSA1/START domain
VNAKKLAVAPAGVVTIDLEVPIRASRERVWAGLTEDPHRWWPKDHRALGPKGRMLLEVRPGGRLHEEDDAGGGLLWYTVLAVEPAASLTLVGHLAPPWGGPATSLLRLVLEAQGAHTLLRVKDSIFGAVDEGFRASTHEGWRSILADGLARHVEDAGPDR